MARYQTFFFVKRFSFDLSLVIFPLYHNDKPVMYFLGFTSQGLRFFQFYTFLLLIILGVSPLTFGEHINLGQFCAVQFGFTRAVDGLLSGILTAFLTVSCDV